MFTFGEIMTYIVYYLPVLIGVTKADFCGSDLKDDVQPSPDCVKLRLDFPPPVAVSLLLFIMAMPDISIEVFCI